MPVLDGQMIRLSYGPRTVLDGVDLTITRGERVGLVGPNGAGKSTLARILSGQLLPDEGKVVRRRGAEVLYLDQTPNPGSHSVRQEVLSGLPRWHGCLQRLEEINLMLQDARKDRLDSLLGQQAKAQAEFDHLGGYGPEHKAGAMLQHLGIHRHDALLDSLSGGELRRVALAKVLFAQPDCAVLDEPTNHLDIPTIEWLEHYLKESYDGALLLITHDRVFLDRVAQRVVEIDDAQLFSYAGGYEDFLVSRATRLSQQQRVEANRQRYLKQEIAWLQRQPKARTTKQKARIQRAEEALSIDAPTVRGQTKLAISSTRQGKTILELRQLGANVPTRDVPLFRELDFIVKKGDRIGVVGPNGCGKTTLLRIIEGELPAAEGEVLRGKNCQIAYLSQSRDLLDPEASVWQNVAGVHGAITINGRDVEPHAYLARFLFQKQVLDQPVSALSGGEQTRVALARLLAQPANLVILDEPTNDLDVETITAVEQMLLDFEGTALVVTHDRWFLDRVATALLVFEDKRVVHHVGDYSDYRARHAPAPPPTAAAKKPATRPTAPLASSSGQTDATHKKLTYAEELELAEIEPRIEAAEGKLEDLERALNDPKIYQSGHEKAVEISAQVEQARRHIEQLMSRWTELEERREAYDA